MASRTRPLDATGVSARAAIARESLQVALERIDLVRAHPPGQPSAEANVAAANAAIAAIAAADALCGKFLGKHSTSANHAEAEALLLEIVPSGREWAKSFKKVLATKSTASYGTFITARTARDATTHAEKLVAALASVGL